MGYSRSRSRSRGGRGGGSDGDRTRIQKMVDERQQCRRDRDFDKADELRDQLRGMGVNIDDTGLTWRGPGGMEGAVANGGSGGIQRRDGDWDCSECGKMNFASREECFSCRAPKPRSSGGRYDDRDRDRGRRGGRYDESPPRRSSRYDRDDSRGRDRRRGGGGSRRYDDGSDDSRSPPPRSRRDRY
mmetsp:Transcript_130948/g.339114  ORF Transcript_130948/g.339114 Transcript_130948/m.339114 type:complete len:186 (+) Transcript_130948:63-620(+)